MSSKLKGLIQKLQTFLFGQEEEINQTNHIEPKRAVGRIELEEETKTRVIHQYPKQGNFRFPVIDDKQKQHLHKYNDSPDNYSEMKKNEKQRESIYQEKQIEKQNFQQKSVDEKKKQETREHRAEREYLERPKFSGKNFRVTNIPSPIHGFQKNTKQVDYPEILHRNQQTVAQERLPNLSNEKPHQYTERKIIDVKVAEQEIASSVDVLIEQEQKHTNELPVETELLQEERSPKNTDCHVERVEETSAIQLELVEQSTTKEHDRVELNLDKTNIMEERESEQTDHQNQEHQLEHQKENTHTLKEEKEEMEQQRKQNVLPFNVMMFHKDRVAIKKSKTSSYQFPSLHLLNIPPKKAGNSEAWVEDKKAQLALTLENFNVHAKVVGVTKGPSVTRFEIQPEPGVKVSKITSLIDDIKLSLAARDIRIEAPIPGKNTIGIEVPNDVSEPVVIREILRSGTFQHDASPLTVAMGLDIEGKPIVTDIQKMPHGLIAGATGSGKSVCINSILVSILFKAKPDEVKLLLIDPKMVELAPYNDIPHLVTPVITDAKQATVALKWAVEEMERRYELFVQNGVRDIKRYNAVMKNDDDDCPAMPYIVIVIDELADLMMVSPQDVEEAICRIAQKARACGIHLLLATQRPSVDVITGLIKANIPTRIAFSVSSQADSRTIIDSGGAERLLGKGDMLLFENGSSKPIRVQGNFVCDEEIDRVIELVKKQQEPNYLFDKETLVKTYEHIDQEDDLFLDACYFALEQGGASSSSLQRRFRIGFNRAARLIDMMEARGIVSEAMGSKPRNVLINEEELETLVKNH